jgi:hypothetical protein
MVLFNPILSIDLHLDQMIEMAYVLGNEGPSGEVGCPRPSTTRNSNGVAGESLPVSRAGTHSRDSDNSVPKPPNPHAPPRPKKQIRVPSST